MFSSDQLNQGPADGSATQISLLARHILVKLDSAMCVCSSVTRLQPVVKFWSALVTVAGALADVKAFFQLGMGSPRNKLWSSLIINWQITVQHS